MLAGSGLSLINSAGAPFEAVVERAETAEEKESTGWWNWHTSLLYVFTTRHIMRLYIKLILGSIIYAH